VKKLIILLMLFSIPGFARSTKDVHKKHFNFLGLKLDAGVPSGLGAAIVAKPVRFLQLELGGTTTLTGGGVKAGVQLMVPWYLSPGVLIEGGGQWAGNLNRLATIIGFSDPKIALLNDVSYNYANFYGTLGVGHSNWFMFNIYAGYSYITGTTNGLQSYIQSKSTNTNNITISEARIQMWIPTGKVAFTFYF
jgi:hypothetical protein